MFKKFLRAVLLAPMTLMFGVTADGGAEEQTPPPEGGNKEKSDQTDNSGQKTFTQAEVNAMMAKEKQQGKLSVLKELGVEDVKNAKDGLSKYQEYLNSQKTDLEKAQGETTTEKSARLAAEQKATQLESKLEAIKLGVKPDCVDDVVALAQLKISDTKDFNSVVSELKTKYPSFFGETTGSEAESGTGNNVKGKPATVTVKGLGTRLGGIQATQTSKKSSYFSK